MDRAQRDRMLADFLEGRLGEPDCEALLTELRADEEFMGSAAGELMVRRFLEQKQFPEGAFTDQVLGTLLEEQSQEDITDEVLIDLQRYRGRQRRRTWVTAGFAAAAMLALGLFLAGLFEKPVSSIVRVVAAEGVGTLNSRALESGKMIRLRRGLLELELNGGESRVVIEAPASFQVVSARHLKLESGRCFAEMETGKTGLRIETPSGDALDLGTKFAVEVNSPSEMNVHVFDGEVEVSSGQVKKRLSEGEAAAFEESGKVASLDANSDVFVHRVPNGIAMESSFLHWSFDEGSGEVVEATGTDPQVELGKGRFLTKEGETGTPEWTSGVVGSALSFDRNSWIETDHPGITGNQDRTVACWAKVPANEGEGTAPLVAWGLSHQSESQMRKSWVMLVDLFQQGSTNRYGQVRINAGKYHTTGTTNLRDGRWHHVAGVAMKGDRGTTILIYVDGELENVSRHHLSIETDTTDQKSKSVQFGRNLFSPRPLFRGSLDEVYVFDSALSGDEVRQLMNLRQPARE